MPPWPTWHTYLATHRFAILASEPLVLAVPRTSIVGSHSSPGSWYCRSSRLERSQACSTQQNHPHRVINRRPHYFPHHVGHHPRSLSPRTYVCHRAGPRSLCVEGLHHLRPQSLIKFFMAGPPFLAYYFPRSTRTTSTRIHFDT